MENLKSQEKVTVLTNGKSLFTLENYDKVTSVCHAHGIVLYKEISKLEARAMHEKGQLHYIYGTGDRKELAGIVLRRKMKLNNFEIK